MNPRSGEKRQAWTPTREKVYVLCYTILYYTYTILYYTTLHQVTARACLRTSVHAYTNNSSIRQCICKFLHNCHTYRMHLTCVHVPHTGTMCVTYIACTTHITYSTHSTYSACSTYIHTYIHDYFTLLTIQAVHAMLHTWCTSHTSKTKDIPLHTLHTIHMYIPYIIAHPHTDPCIRTFYMY